MHLKSCTYFITFIASDERPQKMTLKPSSDIENTQNRRIGNAYHVTACADAKRLHKEHARNTRRGADTHCDAMTCFSVCLWALLQHRVQMAKHVCVCSHVKCTKPLSCFESSRLRNRVYRIGRLVFIILAENVFGKVVTLISIAFSSTSFARCRRCNRKKAIQVI